MKLKLLISLFFISIFLGNCTSKRIIIKDNDICDKYLALKDSIQFMEGEEKTISQVRLNMLRASCATSSNGLPVRSDDEHFHLRSFD